MLLHVQCCATLFECAVTLITGESNLSLYTPLYDAHLAAGGKLVDFSGWQLPIHYGSQIDEHHAVRRTAGMFDVSHMTVVDVGGTGALAWLRRMLTNDVAKLEPGRALYSCLCNDSGGVIDDLIVYHIDNHQFRIVVNAATREQDIAWLQQHQADDVTLSFPEDLAMLAVQGPEAVPLAAHVLNDVLHNSVDLAEVARFGAVQRGEWFVARTGYTGEDGCEITLPATLAADLWQRLLDAGVVPAGLGARDTLRLEAGMALYGNDLEQNYSAVESGLAWTVDLNDAQRDFIGREVLEDQKAFGGRWRRIGLLLEGRGVLRSHQTVQLVGADVGLITSGSFSPTLQRSIAMARVSKPIVGSCDVIIRGKPIAATVVAIPFVKDGIATFGQ